MKKDPIVEEVRKQRERHARRFKYDLKKIVEDYKESEQQRTGKNKRVAEPPASYSAKKRT